MEDAPPSRGFVCVLLLSVGAVVFLWFPAHRPPLAAGTRKPPVAHAPSVRRYGRDGTFYLTQYAAARTGRGVYGFEPGCEVQVVRPLGEKQTMVVSDGQQAVEVSPAWLTNDLDLADAVRREDRAAQAAIIEERLRRQEAYEAAQRPIYIAHAQEAQAAELERVRGSAIGRYRPLERPPQPVGGHDGDGLVSSSRPSSYGNLTDTDADALYARLNQSPFKNLPSALDGNR